MTRASAPGKIILFGEHAVVYQQPALAVPITQVHADVEITNWEPSQKPGTTDPLSAIWIEAPDISLKSKLSAFPVNHPIRFTIENVLTYLGINPASIQEHLKSNGVTIRIISSIPVASGLGSGAAVSTALIQALSHHLEQPLQDEQVNQLCYETEKIHHGNPSGIDNTVITYIKPVYFTRGQPIITFKPGAPFTIIIANTGIAAPTKESVSDVRKLWQADPVYLEGLFFEIGEISRKARSAIETGECQLLGPLMNQNHHLLQELTVSSPELDNLVKIAMDNGALGAKLSGSGRGGNIIALVDPQNQEKARTALFTASRFAPIVTSIQ